MAEKVMAERFLEELLVVLHGKKCFKGIMENSEDIIESLNVAGIARECLNLDKNFKKMQVVNSPSNLTNLQTRDGILHKLSLLWDLFHAVVAKQNSCCSLDKFCQQLCEEDLILQMLFTGLGSEDHFIAFQAQKIVREIVRGFPEIVLQSTFQEMISNGLKENGKWQIIYIIEIIKEVLSLESSLLCEEERLQSYSRKCNCLPEGRNLVPIDFEAIWDTFTHYWLDLCNKCLLKFPLFAEEKQSDINLNKQSCYISVQHALASLLSVGSIIMHSSHKIYQQAAATNEIIQSRATYFKETSQCSSSSLEHKPRYTTTMNINYSQPYLLCQSSEETQNTIDENPCHKFPGEQSKYLNIMESVYEIVRKLVKIDKQELSLDLRRTVVQFLNDIVGDNPQSESELCVQGHLVGICIFLLENVDQLLENGTKLTTDVHFGGQNFKNVSSEKLEAENLVYDKVMTRKVLLLVLKSALITLHAQEERSKYSNWEVLKHSLESWLNFVRKAIGECSENFHHSDKNKTVAALVVMLFADQDDELMTVLLCLFNLYQELFLNESSLPVTEWTNNLRSNFNPHCFFLEFLHSIHCDHSLLLDFLISNETCFLSYFLSYLRHAANDWFGFLAVCNHSALLSINNDYAGLSSSDDGGGSNGGDSDGDDGSNGGDSDGDDGGDSDGDDGSNGDSDGDDGSNGGDSDGDDGSNGGDSDGDDGSVGGSDGSDNDGGGSDSGSGGSGDSGDGDGGDSDGDDGTGGGGSDGGDSDGGGGDDDESGKGGGGDYGDDHYNELIEDFQDHNDYPNDDYNDHIDDIDDTDEDMKSGHGGHDADKYCNQRVRDAADGVVCTMVGRTRNVNQNHVFSPLLSLSNMNNLHQSLSCLIRLRFSIERMISKELFPYPVQALVRVIKYIESLYEGE